MNVIGLGADEQKSVLRLIAAVLHLGNIRFVNQGSKAQVENREGPFCLFSSFFLSNPTHTNPPRLQPQCWRS